VEPPAGKNLGLAPVIGGGIKVRLGQVVA